MGQFTAGLDWLRTVYDWSAPEGERKIWYGLVEEESLSAGFARSLKASEGVQCG